MTIKKRIAELEGKIKGEDRTNEEREAERKMIEEAEKKVAERLKKIRKNREGRGTNG